MALGRNAVSIYQDLVETHGFAHAYNSVKRFVGRNHGFNLEVSARGEPSGAYRKDDADDAWRRTTEMLKQHHPLR